MAKSNSFSNGPGGTCGAPANSGASGPYGLTITGAPLNLGPDLWAGMKIIATL